MDVRICMMIMELVAAGAKPIPQRTLIIMQKQTRLTPEDATAVRGWVSTLGATQHWNPRRLNFVTLAHGPSPNVALL